MRPTISLLLAVLWPLVCAAQPDGAALFREGNSLSRSGVLRTALIRYREAAAAGFDSPLLHYNVGVVRYKLGQYTEAKTEFAKAAEDPALATMATYNLGLVLKALDDEAGATAQFDRVAQTADDNRLRKLARRAAASLDTRAPADKRPARKSTHVREEPKIGELTVRVDAGYAQDDNVYRAPSAPYVDLSQPGQPTVIPETYASPYAPVDVSVQYVLHNEPGDTDFTFGYVLNADYYNRAFANADRVNQKIAIGANMVLGEKGRRKRDLQADLYFRSHYETNFDPDDGFDRSIVDANDNELDISALFRYNAAGMQAAFDHRLGAWRWGFDTRFEQRNYERVSLIPVYDQEVYDATVSIGYDINPATSLSFALYRSRRVFSERPSRDLNGDLLTTNPAQKDDYEGARVGIDRRFGRAVELGFDYLHIDRTDGFVGYYDYARNALRLRATFRPTARFDLSLSAQSTEYDYPNAFAFNEPSAGPKTLESTSGSFFAQFRVTPKCSIWAEIGVQDVTSTDARTAYSRSYSMLGAKWRL